MIGESIALIVALSWTATALFAEVGSKRMGALPFNVVRMSLSLLMLSATLWLTMGAPWPRWADGDTWLWLLLSGLVGYTVGDYCLMQGYIIIGSRFGQLFMTLSAPVAALVGRLLLDEQLQSSAWIGMAVTLSGIALTILGKKEAGQRGVGLRLPAKGILFAAGAGICQGAGLVLSKVGITHYDEALSVAGLDTAAPVAEALLPLPVNIAMPFAATMIRGLMGLAGFVALLYALHPQATQLLRRAIADRRALRAATLSMLFGPFIGVSLSLLATQYTATGIAQTLFSLTPVLIIAPSALLFHQRVTLREIVGAIVSVAGASLFFL